MLPKRVIPCLDVDNGRVVKGTEFVDIYDVGDPVALAQHYEAEGADELVFLDITATTEQRSTMLDVVRRTAANVFIPLTVGGGVRTETDVQVLLDAGADKVAVNSAAVAQPELLDGLTARFGRQCIVLAIDAKRDDDDWTVYTAGGRSETERRAVEWAEEGVRRGVGEILLTSIDQDGTNTGYELDLTRAVSRAVNVPVIASGGAGRAEHYSQAIRDGGAEAVLAASQFHSGKTSIAAVKEHLLTDGIAVRPPESAPFRQPESYKIRPRIALVDYGMGNRQSVQKALERTGAEVVLTGEPLEIEAADGVVLPGVGAFQPGMHKIEEASLDASIKRCVDQGMPVLGICLGAQLLFEESHEGGRRAGLGLIQGTVNKLTSPILPNMGWRQVDTERANPLMPTSSDLQYFYHLHEYAAEAANPPDRLATTALPYGENPDYRILSAARRQNVYGTQFHPEKSGAAGLQLLSRFVSLAASQAEVDKYK